MLMKQSRKVTRNQVWPDTVARLSYRTRYGKGINSMVTTEATIDNLSSKGMLVLTDELIPTDTEVELELLFSDDIGLLANGKVARIDKRGVAIVFTQIDTTKLGECIVQKLNTIN